MTPAIAVFVSGSVAASSERPAPSDTPMRRGFFPDRFDAAKSVAHVPEIGLAILERDAGPRHHHAMLMIVIAGIVVGDDSASRRADGMNVAAALVRRLDIRRRQPSATADVSQDRPARDRDVNVRIGVFGTDEG